jgi:hypothetical protein
MKKARGLTTQRCTATRQSREKHDSECQAAVCGVVCSDVKFAWPTLRAEGVVGDQHGLLVGPASGLTLVNVDHIHTSQR